MLNDPTAADGHTSILPLEYKVYSASLAKRITAPSLSLMRPDHLEENSAQLLSIGSRQAQH